MKRIYNSSLDVIHLFAQRTQDEARTSSGNVYFNDNKIYSYGSHYLLGEFIDDDTILINDRGYSVTTSKHISQIWSATSQYKQFFTESALLNSVYDNIKEHTSRLVNARKPEMYINAILSLFNSMNEYYAYTKKPYKGSAKYRELKRIVDALNDNSTQYKENLKQAAIKADKAKKRKDANRLKDSLSKFNAYEINYFRIGNEDYLRLSEDGTRVETSQGVKIDVDNAKVLYKSIVKGIDIAGEYIEQYRITSMNGTLIIGCHNINMDSVHSVGKQIA